MGKDTIANIITSIRNVDMDKKGMVPITYTNITENIVKIILQEGFIGNIQKHQEGHKYFLVSTLRHRRTRKGIYQTIFKHISRPGLRIYSYYQQIPNILGEIGILILFTSGGIMIDREAQLEIIRGELLCYIC